MFAKKATTVAAPAPPPPEAATNFVATPSENPVVPPKAQAHFEVSSPKDATDKIDEEFNKLFAELDTGKS